MTDTSWRPPWPASRTRSSPSISATSLPTSCGPSAVAGVQDRAAGAHGPALHGSGVGAGGQEEGGSQGEERQTAAAHGEVLQDRDGTTAGAASRGLGRKEEKGSFMFFRRR